MNRECIPKQVKFFIPKTVSESIKICRKNQPRIELIESKESPSLESDLRYILETTEPDGIINRMQKAVRLPFNISGRVRTEYFLTYHQKKPEEQPRQLRKKKKMAHDYVGDEILQVINFSERFERHPLLLFITDFEVGGTKYSKEFLQNEGFIPLERFLGKSNPRWIIIAASPASTVQQTEEAGITAHYLNIPGKINFRFRERYGLFEYRYRLISATDFLRSHSRIRKMARENNVETMIITAEKILVMERIDTSWTDTFSIFNKTLKRHHDIFLFIAGSFVFNFGIGIQQGAIIEPIFKMMDTLGILVLLMWIMQYVYPNVVYTFSIFLSAFRFDKIKSAEKDDGVEPSAINLELKSVLRRLAFYSILSSFMLLAIYPDFFLNKFLYVPELKIIIGVIFIVSSFFRDWPISFEQDALFRILKRSLNDDPELYKNILKINAFAYSGSILCNFAGVLAGWISMHISPAAGIVLSVSGALAAITKLLYPYYGKDYSLALVTNAEPFYSNEHEVVIIPNGVYLKARYPIRFVHLKTKHTLYDNSDFEIVCKNQNHEPIIREKTYHSLNNKHKRWRLTFENQRRKIRITIIVKDRTSSLALNRALCENHIVYRLEAPA